MKDEKLDDIFGKYIRLRGTNDYGYGVCITCGGKFHYRTLTCGHFRKRGNHCTRWHEQNAHAQCPKCNQEDDFNKYEKRMIEIYGETTTEEITRMSLADCKLTDESKKELYEYYRRRVKELIGSKMFVINVNGR